MTMRMACEIKMNMISIVAYNENEKDAATDKKTIRTK